MFSAAYLSCVDLYMYYIIVYYRYCSTAVPLLVCTSNSYRGMTSQQAAFLTYM